MINYETTINMMLKNSTPITAYACEGPVKLVFHNEAWLKTKRLIIAFDKQEALQHGNYRLADSDEVLWWAGASDCEIPEIIECADGVFHWIEPGFDLVVSGLFKI